ncbi:hypothetical protein JTB14_008098 [Gonioctena quinquepunctata]|nr:hypothetical protein JTB14_008098 [Gonioctena quinquepunctata]
MESVRNVVQTPPVPESTPLEYFPSIECLINLPVTHPLASLSARIKKRGAHTQTELRLVRNLFKGAKSLCKKTPNIIPDRNPKPQFLWYVS